MPMKNIWGTFGKFKQLIKTVLRDYKWLIGDSILNNFILICAELSQCFFFIILSWI